MQNNSITFTSNIKFVSRSAFDLIKGGDRIGYKHNEPNLMKAKEFIPNKSEPAQAADL